MISCGQTHYRAWGGENSCSSCYLVFASRLIQAHPRSCPNPTVQCPSLAGDIERSLEHEARKLNGGHSGLAGPWVSFLKCGGLSSLCHQQGLRKPTSSYLLLTSSNISMSIELAYERCSLTVWFCISLFPGKEEFFLYIYWPFLFHFLWIICLYLLSISNSFSLMLLSFPYWSGEVYKILDHTPKL